ncbi:alpha/beta hydrolase family protein [Myroides odoratimimus]|uniref:Peptidase S9 prolyl oligopeptidase catalytic domain-containing protein n=1 Tax=Myroides odoratimimus CCUG 10230 TaxID=883150 RepID=A0ABP2NEN5_9FLAO|nr:prolyl oligopeptidase family serine peptidase [Myroides odoratimimus]EHO11904.1 hypothetical protein HMPREF9712_00151 [Myroides odoratimimus CCUG 10230]
MVINKIIICYTIIITSFVSIGFGQTKSDTIQIDSRWSTLNNILLSDDGRWSLLTKNSTTVELLLLNTQNKKQYKFKAINNFHLTKNNTFLYQDVIKENIELINLENNKSNTIQNATLLEFLKDENILVYQNNNTKQNYIARYHNNTLHLLCDTLSMFFKNYSISPDKKTLIYQSLSNNQLFKIDLSKNTHTYLSSFSFPVLRFYWKNNSELVSFYLQDVNESKQIFIVNLKDNTLKKTELLCDDYNLSTVNNISYYNDSVIIEYQLKKDKKATISPDIWATNNRNLTEKIYTNKSIDFKPKTLIYNILSTEKDTINMNKNTRLLNIGDHNLIGYNTTENYDYTNFKRPTNFYLFDKISFLPKLIIDQILNYNSNFSFSPNGKYIAYKNKKNWAIYNLETKEILENKNFKTTLDHIIWSADSEIIYGINQGILIKLDLLSLDLEQTIIDTDSNLEFTIYNTVALESQNNSNAIRVLKLNTEKRILLASKNPTNNLSSLYLVEKNKVIPIVKNTPNSIDSILFDKDLKTITYSEQNFKIPNRIQVWKENKIKTLKENETPIELYNWRKQKIIQYTVQGKSMKGVLYYPKDFQESKKYPMITSIYQVQYKYANLFNSPELAIDGFNTSVFTENNYFVFYPDIVYNNSGPAISALQCVEVALETILSKELAIDKNKLGLTGRSHGGYETNYIITQTDIFKAAVSGVGNSDLIRAYYSYNLNFGIPNYFKMENGQYEMPSDFAKNKELYLNNSPILYAHQIKTPLLTWTGNKDENVHWGQTQEFFIALLRYKIPHVALFYPNETHSILNPLLKQDLNHRVLQWFNYYLKDHKDIEWIQKNTTFN